MEQIKKEITIWYKLNKEEWEFNHIEDNYVENISPIPKSDTQKSWKKAVWKRIYGHLINGVVVENPMTTEEFTEALITHPLLKMAWVSLKKKGWSCPVSYIGNDIDYCLGLGDLMEEMRLIKCAIDKADDKTKLEYENYVKGNKK